MINLLKLLCIIHCRVEAACDLEVLATAKYSGPYFLEEIKGLADATGLDYKVIKTENII